MAENYRYYLYHGFFVAVKSCNEIILLYITPPTSFQLSHWLKRRHVTFQYFIILGQLQKIWG